MGSNRISPEGRARSRAVMANAARTREERERTAADFRVRLMGDLGITDATAVQDALLTSAVSAFTEICAVSASFRRCHASPKQMARLGRVRSELRRTLRLLGVRTHPGDAPDPMAALRAVEAEIIAARKPAAESEAGDVAAET